MSKGFLGPEMPRIGKNPGNLNPPITSYKAAPNKKKSQKKHQEILRTLLSRSPSVLKTKISNEHIFLKKNLVFWNHNFDFFFS